MTPPPGGWREAVSIVDRQSGKSRIAALVAAYEAVIACRELDRTELYALMVSEDHRASMRRILTMGVELYSAQEAAALLGRFLGMDKTRAAPPSALVDARRLIVNVLESGERSCGRRSTRLRGSCTRGRRTPERTPRSGG